MSHICQTIRRHFSLHQVKLCIGQQKYKQKFMTQGRKDQPTDRASEFVLAHLTPISHILQNSRKNMYILICTKKNYSQIKRKSNAKYHQIKYSGTQLIQSPKGLENLVVLTGWLYSNSMTGLV